MCLRREPAPERSVMPALHILLACLFALLTTDPVNAAYLDRGEATSSSEVPQYSQTTPQIYAGIESLHREIDHVLIRVARADCNWTDSVLSSVKSSTLRCFSVFRAKYSIRDCSPHRGRCQQDEHLQADGRVESIFPKPEVR